MTEDDRRAMADGRLVQVLPDWKLPEFVIYAVTPRRGEQPAKVRHALTLLARLLRQAHGLRAQQLPQHKGQNAAGAVVVHLHRGVYAQQQGVAGLGAVRPRHQQLRLALRVRSASGMMLMVSLPVSPRLFQLSPALNCSGSTPMPTRLER